MKIVSKDFRVSPSATLKLGQWPTLVKPFYENKEHYRELLDEHVSELSKLQELLYASNTHCDGDASPGPGSIRIDLSIDRCRQALRVAAVGLSGSQGARVRSKLPHSRTG